MNDRNIRTAFHNLEKDVTFNVETEARLERITRRRTWVRPAFATFAGAAAAALIVGAAVLAFRPDTAPDRVPPATGGPSSTVAPTTAAPDTTTPTARLPELRPGTVVIADMGILAIEEQADSVAFLGERVIGDGSGGIVVQVDERLIHYPSLLEDAGDLVNARDIATGDAPVTIQLQDLAYVDGSPRVIYTVTVGSGFDGYEEVRSYDLTAGTDELLLRQDGEGDYEDTITRASLANDILVLTFSAPGTTYFEFYDGAGDPIEVAQPALGPDGSFADFFSPVDQGVLSSDGSRLAYVQIQNVTTGEEGYVFADIIVWDLAEGVELQRLELELREGDFAPLLGRMDYDGAGIVLGRFLNFIDGPVMLPPLRIESLADGTVAELDTAGSPSLIK